MHCIWLYILYIAIYIIYVYYPHYMTPLDPSKLAILIKIGFLWAWQNLWGYGRKVHAKFWLWGMAWGPSYDHFRTHVATQRANSYWWSFPILAIWQSLGLIFVLVLLNSSREIQRRVYQLWRMDFLRICWFSIIYMCFVIFVKVREWQGRENEWEKGREKEVLPWWRDWYVRIGLAHLGCR